MVKNFEGVENTEPEGVNSCAFFTLGK